MRALSLVPCSGRREMRLPAPVPRESWLKVYAWGHLPGKKWEHAQVVVLEPATRTSGRGFLIIERDEAAKWADSFDELDSNFGVTLLRTIDELAEGETLGPAELINRLSEHADLEGWLADAHMPREIDLAMALAGVPPMTEREARDLPPSMDQLQTTLRAAWNGLQWKLPLADRTPCFGTKRTCGRDEDCTCKHQDRAWLKIEKVGNARINSKLLDKPVVLVADEGDADNWCSGSWTKWA